MKHISKRMLAWCLALALLVTCAVSGLVLPTAAEATTVLWTENFEGDTTIKQIKNWMNYAEVTADPVDAGNKVLKVTSAMNNQWTLNAIGIQPNRLYGVRLRAYGASVTINTNIGTSKGTVSPVSNKAHTGDAWEEITYLFRTLDTVKNDGYVLKMTAAVGAYIDDICLVDLGEVSDNLLVDGTFDLPVSYDYSGFWNAAISGGASVTADPKNADNKALYFPSDYAKHAAKYYGAIVQPSWEKGETYEVSMKIYGGPISLYMNADKGITEGSGWHTLTADDYSQWTTVKHAFTFSESKASNDSYVFALAIDAATNGTYVDDIKIAKKAAEPATAIALDKTTLTLGIGGSETLSVVATPEDGTYETPVWTSSDPTVVSVENGKVTALANGTATITVTAGTLSASCTVNVPKEAEGFILSTSTLHLAPGAAKTVIASANPVGSVLGTVTWSSDNTAVATVDQNGKITAVANGTAKIAVETEKFIVWIDVTVSPYGEVITGGDFENNDWNIPLWTTNLIKDGAGTVVEEADGNHVLQLKPSTNAVYFQGTPLKAGSTYRLTYRAKGGTVRTSISGSHASSGSGWANTTPADGEWVEITRVFVPKSGYNKNFILAIGATTATPTYIDDVSIVELPAATAIVLDKTAETLSHNQTLQLSATAEPAESSLGTLTWSSSDPTVATVDANGLVTALKSGETTITVTNGTLSASCVITVPLIAETFTLKEETLHFAVGTFKTLTLVTDGGLSAGEITWTTSDASIVTVENGKITAVANGTAVITAKNWNNVTDTVTVTVDAYGERLSGGDFENGDYANNSSLTTNIIKDGRGQVVEENGNFVAKFPADMSSTMYFAPVPGEAGKTYVVTFKAKGTSVRTHVIGTHNAGGDIGERTFTLKADEWTEVRYTYQPKSGFNKNYAVGISNRSGAELVIDDFSIVELPDADELVVTPDEVELLPNGTSSLKVSTVPALSNMGTVTWESSDPTIVSVDQEGNIAAVAARGTVTITVTNDKGKVGKATVKINEYANLLTNGDFEMGNTLYYNADADLSQMILPGIGKDGSYGLLMHNTTEASKITTYYRKALPLSPGTTYILSFDYLSNNSEDIRLWSGTMGFGNIYTGKGKGQWKTASKVFTTPADMALNTNWDLGIVVDGAGEASAVVDNLCLKLYNSGVEAESIVLSKTTMTLIPGRTGALAAYATPVDGDTNQMIWTSSNEDVATVEYGVVTGVGKGTAIITGTTKNGKSASCTVTVSGNETYIKNGTFDKPNDDSWTLGGGAMLADKTGVSSSNAAKLAENATVSQKVTGTFKAETEYQLIVRYRTPSKKSAGVLLTDGTTEYVNDKTGNSAYWKKQVFEFKTGETAPTELTLTFTGEGEVYIDNIILAQKASLVDLVVEDIIWDGGDSQVKPGDKLTFAATVRNTGEDKVKVDQSFVINFCLDGKVIATATHEGLLDSGDSVILISEAAWAAEGIGDHTISAHVNPTLSVLEINDANNTMQVNLRIANERLEAPEQAQVAGMTDLIFSDDFNSDATIDKYATGDHGYKWYVTANWGNGTATTDDYSVTDGILSLHRKSTPNNITLSTMDINTGNGFSWNTGYLEFRVRVVDADGAQVNNVGNVPAVWSFPREKHMEIAGKNIHYVEMDWLEYWGLDTEKWPSRPGGYYTISLHDMKKGDGPDGYEYWYANGGSSGRYQEGLGDEQWHVMGFRWEKGKLTGYFDGVKNFEQKWSEDSEPKPSANQPNGGLPTDMTSVFSLIDEQFNILYLSGHEKNPMELDYVRIWQGDGTIVSPDDPDEGEGEEGGDVQVDIEPEDFHYNFCTDAYGDLITEINEDTYLSILAGKELWAALTAERKAEINAYLAEQGQPSFDELLAAAEAFANGDGEGEETPDTGEHTALPAAALAAVMGAAVLWMTRKRKQK